MTLFSEPIINAMLVIIGILLVICIIKHILHGIITLGILIVLVPLLYTLFFGDGSSIVKQATQFLSPEIGQQVEESYQYFQNKVQEKPVLNQEKIKDVAKKYLS